MIARARLILYTLRKKASGKYPVKLRVTFNRQHRDYVIGVDLIEADFEKAMRDVPPKSLRNEATTMQNHETRARMAISQMGIFTFEKFESAFRGQTKDASDIFPFFDDYVADLKKEDRIKTAIAYQTAANAFRTFHGKKKLHLMDITSTFLKKFQDAALADGKSISTVGIYVRALRVIYNYCITKGIIKRDESYPFGRSRFIIPSGKNIKKALTIEEIRKIHELTLKERSVDDRSRDMWMFSYYCNGMNFKDIALLKHKNVDGDMIRFVREKTKRTGQADQKIISCFITEKTAAIIKKWGTHSSMGNEQYIFPILAPNDTPTQIEAKVNQFIKTTNKSMDRICRSLGINKKVTTYFSRHSAATVMKKSGASIIQIQEALGHSSPMVTQKYLDSFDDEVKKNLANALTSF